MRILTLVPGGISDQLLFFPTLETLRQTYPQSSIDVLVEPRAKAAYRLCPQVREVLLFDYRDQYGLADYLNILGVIRDREYEIAISLTNRPAINLLLWLNGVPNRIGYENNGSWFLSEQVPRPTEGYLADNYHALVKGLKIAPPCPPLKLTLNRDDIDWAQMEQQRLNIKDSGYILLYAGGSDLSISQGLETVYPLESWLEIIQGIRHQQPDLPIVAIQGELDEDWVLALKAMDNNLKVSRTADIGKMAAMIAGANLLLATESVPLQLAVAVGTYTLSLLVPSLPKRVLPSRGELHRYIEANTGKVADITPETVLKKIWGR
ncbi:MULTISPECIES: glycosyltransferase family 9 protein [Microcystis]|uniref:glycosyltransferase family 9 protein n=1 Tax=Microcystis TaxID=1125 RepID=UPI0016804A07|nr:glycosyltransferase family 9 protein [Microcystis wesenbergii]MBD2118605.1 glycosyltransferase family 9 protein [Microcystis wesenbergii FACHB-1339]